MRQLLLLRHAKSSWDDPKLPDHARPLNARGRQAAAAIGSAMRQLALVPDIVLVSSARRTLQTLEAIGPWDESPLIEPMDALYLAEARQILCVLNEVAETVRSVLVIGHNPGLHDLAVLLAGDHAITAGEAFARKLGAGYPTGALAEYTVPGPWWQLDSDRARLLRFLTPKDLSEKAA